MLMLRELGKKHVEIAQITDYTHSCVSTTLKRLEGYTPQKPALRSHEPDDATMKDWLSIADPTINAREKL